MFDVKIFICIASYIGNGFVKDEAYICNIKMYNSVLEVIYFLIEFYVACFHIDLFGVTFDFQHLDKILFVIPELQFISTDGLSAGLLFKGMRLLK